MTSGSRRQLQADQRSLRDAHVEVADQLRLVAGDPRSRTFELWLRDQIRACRRGDRQGIDRCLAYLAADPFHFRSGYLRHLAALAVAQAPLLTPAQRHCARELVRRCLRRELHSSVGGVAALAAQVVDNQLRRDLRAALHSPDHRLAWVAVRVIVRVRHPGLAQRDVAAFRRVVLVEAGRGPWLGRNPEAAAQRLWSRDWADELLTRVGESDPQSEIGALRLLDRFTL